MSHNVSEDQRRGGRGTVEARKRRRLRPTLLALEDRRLLSTFTVNNTRRRRDSDRHAALGDRPGECGRGRQHDQLRQTGVQHAADDHPDAAQLELSNTTGTETIYGPGGGRDGQRQQASRVFQVDGGVTASISGLTITGGRTHAALAAAWPTTARPR